MNTLYDEIYKNVQDGLKSDEVPEYVKRIYKNSYSRIIVEGLLLDETTPSDLFKSLAGLDSDDIQIYRYYFFNIPNNFTRLEKYSLYYGIDDYFKTATKAENNFRKEIYLNVIEYGWYYVDQLFNKGELFNFNDSYKPVMASLMAFLNKKLLEAMSSQNLTDVHKIIKIMNDMKKNYTEKETSKQQQLLLEFEGDLASVSSELKFLDINKEYKQLKPIQSKEKANLKEILNDVKPKATNQKK